METLLKKGLSFTLKTKEESTVVYFYHNPDADRLGFGFNTADGGGFVPLDDLTKDTAISMTFGQAVEAAKLGYKVARTGWNGAGMFAYIVPANSYPAVTDAVKGVFENDMVPYNTYWALKTVQGSVSTWAPSGSDSLAEDWCIVD